MDQMNATSAPSSRDKPPLKRVESLNCGFNGALKWRFTGIFPQDFGHIGHSEQPISSRFVPVETSEIAALDMGFRLHDQRRIVRN
ncbi:MAG: hypothetical protein B7Y00_05575 [Sphingomonadales bacterium 17-56-6]|nr:MAG: hypothetical protein B7Y00_05575 [Sphingomonadales bacterium 17-56-6]